MYGQIKQLSEPGHIEVTQIWKMANMAKMGDHIVAKVQSCQGNQVFKAL